MKLLVAALVIIILLTTVVAASVFADPGDNDDYVCPSNCGQQYCQGADGNECPGLDAANSLGYRGGCGGSCGGR